MTINAILVTSNFMLFIHLSHFKIALFSLKICVGPTEFSPELASRHQTDQDMGSAEKIPQYASCHRGKWNEAILTRLDFLSNEVRQLKRCRKSSSSFWRQTLVSENAYLCNGRVLFTPFDISRNHPSKNSGCNELSGNRASLSFMMHSHEE